MSTPKLTPGRYQGRDPATGKAMEPGITAIVSPKLAVSYQARWSWTDEAGRRRQATETFRDLDLAEDHLLSTKLRIRRGQYAPESTVTMDEYFERWFARQLAGNKWRSSTAHRIRTTWENLFAGRIGGVPIVKLTKTMYQAEIDHLAGLTHPGNPERPLYAASTVRLKMTVPSSLLKAAIREEIISIDPSYKADLPKKRKKTKAIWSATHARHFLDAMQKDRQKALWWFLCTTACRIGEAIALRWSAVDFDAQCVTFRATRRRSLQGKFEIGDGTKGTDEEKVVPLIPIVVDMLRELQREQRKGQVVPIDGFVFPALTGNALCYESIARRFKRLVRTVGLPWVGFHGIRHSTATLLVSLKVPESVVQQVLRHASRAVTDTYLHPDEEQMRDGLELLMDVFAPQLEAARAGENTTTLALESGARVENV